MYYYPHLEDEDMEARRGIYLPRVPQLARTPSRASVFNDSAVPHIPALQGERRWVYRHLKLFMKSRA